MDLDNDGLIILFYMQKYNFLTIDQAGAVLSGGRSYQMIARKLREMAGAGLVGSFGGNRVGFARVPKVYFLKKKGYEILLDNNLPPEILGRFREKSEPRWSPQTMHRLHLVDVFLSLEEGIRGIDHLDLRKVFLEYNKVSGGGKVLAETTDFISDDEQAENKIVPDGAFILASQKTLNNVLFLVEMDMGTEGIVDRISKDKSIALYERMKKYDRYLVSGRYAKKYKDWGNFDHFVLLFVTLSGVRMENIRKKFFDLPARFSQYYFFNTYDEVKSNFFNGFWKVRAVDDDRNYSVLG